MKMLLILSLVVLALFLPVGQTQANANQPINGEVAVANDVGVMSDAAQIQVTQMLANDVAKKTDMAQPATEQMIQMTISQANPAVDEAEQANTAEAWNHRMASGVDRGEAPMINEAGIFTASFNDAIETANQNNLDHRNGSVIKTCTPARTTPNSTNIADVATALRT